MTHYNVTTPLYWTGFYEMEPPEQTCDSVSVDAPNKRAAKVEGVRLLRAKGSEWFDDGLVSPFTGLTVEQPLCEHGFCWCDICADDRGIPECPHCIAEWDAAEKAEELDPGSPWNIAGVDR